MNKSVEDNLNKQIYVAKNNIRQCPDEEFNGMVYKYIVFNRIKNSIDEGLIKTNKYQNILENDNEILEKIYTKFLGVNVFNSPEVFDDVMLETFLSEEQSLQGEIEEEKEI